MSLLQASTSASTSQTTSSAPQTASNDDPTFGPLERAGKILDERLARDERWVGVGDSLSGELARCWCG